MKNAILDAIICENFAKILQHFDEIVTFTFAKISALSVNILRSAAAGREAARPDGAGREHGESELRKTCTKPPPCQHEALQVLVESFDAVKFGILNFFSFFPPA